MRTTLRGLAALTAAGLTLALAPTANAAVRGFNDARGDADGSVDILRTTVTNEGKQVKVGMKTVRGTRQATLWSIDIDTQAKNAGPEFRVNFRRDGGGLDGLMISRVTGFDDVFGDIRRCPGLKTRIVGAQTRRFDIPRSCMKIRGKQPGQVRVSVFGSGARGLGDFHPGDRRLLGFVKHN